MPGHAKEYSLDVAEFTLRANESCFDEFEFLKMVMKVVTVMKVEGVFRATECRLAQMNVFSHYCLTFRANDCIFSLNEQQKV